MGVAIELYLVLLFDLKSNFICSCYNRIFKNKEIMLT